MPTLLFYSQDDPVDLWVPELRKRLPRDVKVVVHPDIGDPAEIDYALVWKPPAGMIAGLPNCKVIFSIAAGIDHILADPERPTALPIVRMVDPALRDMMSEHAMLGVLYFHRFLGHYLENQPKGIWDRKWARHTPDHHVAVLGLGHIGAEVARKFAVYGFQVHGWSRSEKRIPGVECRTGDKGLTDVLSRANYVVNVLPLTDETRTILSATTFELMPKGAVIVNLGRGGHVAEDDLIPALDSGQLGGAFLDVFETEPLPKDHPFWRHPKIVVTPHVAGELLPQSCAQVLASNVRKHIAGETIPHIVDLERGY
ncbi:MAG: glyoxylate/hydroxypyruvate reductase A [Alphaproteobacteria bacterium]